MLFIKKLLNYFQVKGWKNLHLRVFLCYGHTSEVTDLTDFRNQRNNEYRFKQQLHLLRISATIHQVTMTIISYS